MEQIKMEDIKTWNEATKLKKSEIVIIALDIIFAVLNITIGIVNKEISWTMFGIMWIFVAFMDYSNLKIDKGNKELINLQEKRIKVQEEIINALLKETAVEIEINKIKIPSNFTKPNPKKLQQKYNYYRKNHKFESPIVIDMNYNLIDGYTSYLIAKECHRETVIVKLQRKVMVNNEN